MKNLIDSNFTPSHQDIFNKDSMGNIIYTFLGKDYIISSQEKEEKLLKIEGYKPYIFSLKPPIFIPIIIVSFMFSIFISFIFQLSEYIRLIVLSLSLGLYIISIFIYYLIIYNIIKE